MARIQTMRIKEQLSILVKMMALEDEGKQDEAFELQKQIPLPHYMGKYAKEFLGVDWFKNCGWDLSEVEAVYGKDYITK